MNQRGLSTSERGSAVGVVVDYLRRHVDAVQRCQEQPPAESERRVETLLQSVEVLLQAAKEEAAAVANKVSNDVVADVDDARLVQRAKLVLGAERAQLMQQELDAIARDTNSRLQHDDDELNDANTTTKQQQQHMVRRHVVRVNAQPHRVQLQNDDVNVDVNIEADKRRMRRILARKGTVSLSSTSTSSSEFMWQRRRCGVKARR